MEKNTSSIIFLLINFLYSETYIVSYLSRVKNSILSYESFYISKAMVEKKLKIKDELKIHTKNFTNAKDFLEKNKDIVINFLLKQDVFIKSSSINSNKYNKDEILLSIPSTYLKVYFNNDFAKISLLK